jgi:transposase
MLVNTDRRAQALEEAGLRHPRPEAVISPLFGADNGFFMAADKVQVKYEMLRAHAVDGATVTAAAADHGFSRAEFYLVASAFEEAGMAGLLDKPRGRHGPIRLTEEIRDFIADAPEQLSGAALVEEVAKRFGVSLHRRTIERARR